MAVSAMLAMGVLPGMKRNSSGVYPLTAVKAFAKMGHKATPKGRSRVGMPTSSQSGEEAMAMRSMDWLGDGRPPELGLETGGGREDLGKMDAGEGGARAGTST